MKLLEQSTSISPFSGLIPIPISSTTLPRTRTSARNERSLLTTVPFLRTKPEFISLSSFPQAKNQQKRHTLELLIKIHPMRSLVKRLQGLVDKRLDHFLNL